MQARPPLARPTPSSRRLPSKSTPPHRSAGHPRTRCNLQRPSFNERRPQPPPSTGTATRTAAHTPPRTTTTTVSIAAKLGTGPLTAPTFRTRCCRACRRSATCALAGSSLESAFPSPASGRAVALAEDHEMSACERVEVCLPAGRLSVFAEPSSLSCRPALAAFHAAPQDAASRVMCVWPPLIPVPFRLNCATDQALGRSPSLARLG